MKDNKNSKSIYLIIFVVCFIGGFIYGYNNVNGPEAQEKKLREELIQIANILTTEEDYSEAKEMINRTITSGKTLEKEKLSKEYFKQVVDLVDGFMTIKDVDFENILTYDNFEKDRPNFTNTLDIIDSTLDKINDFVDKYNELMDEEYIKKYIDDEKVIQTIGPNRSKKIMTIVVDPAIKTLKQSREIIVFLRDNNDDWIIEDDTIYFLTDEEVETYNKLISEL